ncbi:MAG: methyltransferase domain-containing protein [Candidatus Bathyarchaeota archaeon]|nr:methyltransferase domain-containing protein [Candidatus Bathyarchaeota archaeon]
MSDKLSLEEVERLGYYDFMGHLGVPFFNIGGFASIDRLAELCHITGETRILEVGCGTGTNACYLAEKYGCTVVGIDLAEHMVRQATRKAEERGLADRVSFRVGDAYHLDFPDAAFDAVVTVFVSQFLDPDKAFLEFLRVLRGGGYLGVNEMYRAENVPSEINEKVDDNEKTFRELTELPFTLRSPETWHRAFVEGGFTDITVEEHPNSQKQPYSGGIVEEFGGWRKLMSTLWRLLVYALRSGEMRKRFAKISGTKKVLIKDKDTSKYIGYVLCVGKKGST